MIKRGIVLLLAIILIMGILPLSVFAGTYTYTDLWEDIETGGVYDSFVYARTGMYNFVMYGIYDDSTEVRYNSSTQELYFYDSDGVVNFEYIQNTDTTAPLDGFDEADWDLLTSTPTNSPVSPYYITLYNSDYSNILDADCIIYDENGSVYDDMRVAGIEFQNPYQETINYDDMDTQDIVFDYVGMLGKTIKLVNTNGTSTATFGYMSMLNDSGTLTLDGDTIPYNVGTNTINIYYSDDGETWSGSQDVIEVTVTDNEGFSFSVSGLEDAKTYYYPPNFTVYNYGTNKLAYVYVNDTLIDVVLLNEQEMYVGDINFIVWGDNEIKVTCEGQTDIVFNILVARYSELEETGAFDIEDTDTIIDEMPDREDYDEGMLGNLSYGLDVILYLLKLPFDMLKDFAELLGNGIESILNTIQPILNLIGALFGVLPNTFVVGISTIFVIIVILGIIKLFRG